METTKRSEKKPLLKHIDTDTDDDTEDTSQSNLSDKLRNAYSNDNYGTCASDWHHNRIRNSELGTAMGLDSEDGLERTGLNLGNRIMVQVKKFRMHPKASQLLTDSLLPVVIWVVLLLIVGQDSLPGGSVFILVILECLGRVLGYLVSCVHLPPMVGMLGLGIAVKNIPGLDLTQHWNQDLSSPIRQIALAVILTRAGFGLDLKTLIKFKWLVVRLAVTPTVIEAGCVAVLTHFILDFPWIWGLLVGFVVAAVSPAVIVPRILHLKSEGYGEKKGIPTVVLASASLDNVVAISLFGVALGFVFSSKSMAEMVLQCPIEIFSGCGFGIVWGLINAFVFNPAGSVRFRKIHGPTIPNPDESMVKGLFILGGGIGSIFGFKLVNYSGAGALGCIISAFVTCTIWKQRCFEEAEINQIKWGFTFMWKFFEPLLFGVIGLQMVISDLDGHTVLLSVACLVAGAIIRFVITYAVTCHAGLNTKEKLFIALSWIPKATVQAAIGPIALDYVKNMRNIDPHMEQLANQVLTMAVVVILLTAPIGELAVIVSGPRLLTKEEQNTESEAGPSSS